MGSCCSSGVKYGGFRHDLNSPLLNDKTISKYKPNSKMFVISLIGLEDIPAASSFSGLSDPYVEMRLLPEDPVAGSQKQISSIKPSTIDPIWEPPEKFKFITSDLEGSKIIISVYHFNNRNAKNSQPLADTVFKLKGFPCPSNYEEKNLNLISPKNGKHSGKLNIAVECMSIEQANDIQEHTVYEFQRWKPVLDWGSSPPPTGHFLITDPGRWSTEDGKRFGKEIEDVATPVSDEWEVVESWNTVATKYDPDGWQYSTSFESPYWYDQCNSSSFVVRRRTWHRKIQRTSNTTSNSNRKNGLSALRQSTNSNPSNQSRSSSRASSTASSGNRRQRLFGKKK